MAGQQTAPTRELLTEFDRLHRELFGVASVINGGKDAKLLAGLWQSHGDLVRELMADFFATDDAWIQQAGYSVGVFVSQAAKLIARRHAARLPQARDPRLRPTAVESNLRGFRDDLAALHELEAVYDERRSDTPRRPDQIGDRRS